jgi:hypothetical protein
MAPTRPPPPPCILAMSDETQPGAGTLSTSIRPTSIFYVRPPTVPAQLSLPRTRRRFARRGQPSDAAECESASAVHDTAPTPDPRCAACLSTDAPMEISQDTVQLFAVVAFSYCDQVPVQAPPGASPCITRRHGLRYGGREGAPDIARAASVCHTAARTGSSLELF